jgi:hypothetical protein
MPATGRGKPRALRVPISHELTPDMDPYTVNPATPYFIKYSICVEDELFAPNRMFFFQLTRHENPEGKFLLSRHKPCE